MLAVVVKIASGLVQIILNLNANGGDRSRSSGLSLAAYQMTQSAWSVF